MKTLLLIRHAKSDQKNFVGKERNRPITKKAEGLAKKTGERMRARSLVPALILASPAKKAAQTVEIIGREIEFQGKVKVVDALYMAEADSLLKVIRKAPEEADCLLVVGHNPGLESLIPELTHEITALPHAGLAWLSLPIEHWKDVKQITNAQLVELWDPRKDEDQADPPVSLPEEKPVEIV